MTRPHSTTLVRVDLGGFSAPLRRPRPRPALPPVGGGGRGSPPPVPPPVAGEGTSGSGSCGAVTGCSPSRGGRFVRGRRTNLPLVAAEHAARRHRPDVGELGGRV